LSLPLNQINLFHALSTDLRSICILSYTCLSLPLTWSFSFRFPTTLLHAFLFFPCVLRAPPLSPLFDHIMVKSRNHEPPQYTLSASPPLLPPSLAHTCSSALLSRALSAEVFPTISDEVSQPWKMIEIIVMYILIFIFSERIGHSRRCSGLDLPLTTPPLLRPRLKNEQSYILLPSVPSWRVMGWTLPFLPFIFFERNLKDKILNRILTAENFWGSRPRPITFTCHLYLCYCLISHTGLYSANNIV